jgi:hypothetical protein
MSRVGWCHAKAGTTPPSATSPTRPEPLPNDVATLTALVEELQQKNRLVRAEKAHLQVELDLVHDELREVAFNSSDEQTKGIMGKFTGWLRRRRPLLTRRSDRPVEIDIRVGDCLAKIADEPNVYDGIITDAPYSIGLHGKEGDSTDMRQARRSRPVSWWPASSGGTVVRTQRDVSSNINICTSDRFCPSDQRLIGPYRQDWQQVGAALLRLQFFNFRETYDALPTLQNRRWPLVRQQRWPLRMRLGQPSRTGLSRANRRRRDRDADLLLRA